MINDGDANHVKRDYLDILEYIFKQKSNKDKEKNNSPNQGDSLRPRPKEHLTIYISGKKVYEASRGEKPSINTLDDQKTEILNKSLSDPQSFDGTILIKVDNEKVFHSQKGKVDVDTFGLTNSTVQSHQKTPQQRTYSVEALQKQVAVLHKKLGEQQKLVDSIKSEQQTPELLSQLAAQVSEMSKSLEKQQQLIDQTQKALSQVNEGFLPQVQNTKLQNWVGSVERQVKQTAKNVFERVKDALTPEVTKLRNEISDLKSQLNEQITSLKNEVRNRASNDSYELNQQVNNFKSELRTQTDNILNTVETSLNEVRHHVDSKIQGIQSSIENTKSEFNQAVEDVKSYAVEQSVKAFMKLFAKENPDGSMLFKSASFDFEQQGDNIIVRAKNGATVLENGALSPQVSEQQLQALEKVQSVVDMHHQIEQNQKQESESRGMHR